MDVARDRSSDGFGLVEVIVALFLLGLAAVALLPLLITGVGVASEQSSVATATRHLNALIEDARAQPSCGTVSSIVAGGTFKDGANRTLSYTGIGGACTPGSTVLVTLTARDPNMAELAKVSALVYIQ